MFHFGYACYSTQYGSQIWPVYYSSVVMFVKMRHFYSQLTINPTSIKLIWVKHLCMGSAYAHEHIDSLYKVKVAVEVSLVISDDLCFCFISACRVRECRWRRISAAVQGGGRRMSDNRYGKGKHSKSADDGETILFMSDDDTRKSTKSTNDRGGSRRRWSSKFSQRNLVSSVCVDTVQFTILLKILFNYTNWKTSLTRVKQIFHICSEFIRNCLSLSCVWTLWTLWYFVISYFN